MRGETRRERDDEHGLGSGDRVSRSPFWTAPTSQPRNTKAPAAASLLRRDPPTKDTVIRGSPAGAAVSFAGFLYRCANLPLDWVTSREVPYPQAAPGLDDEAKAPRPSTCSIWAWVSPPTTFPRPGRTLTSSRPCGHGPGPPQYLADSRSSRRSARFDDSATIRSRARSRDASSGQRSTATELNQAYENRAGSKLYSSARGRSHGGVATAHVGHQLFVSATLLLSVGPACLDDSLHCGRRRCRADAPGKGPQGRSGLVMFREDLQRDQTAGAWNRSRQLRKHSNLVAPATTSASIPELERGGPLVIADLGRQAKVT